MKRFLTAAILLLCTFAIKAQVFIKLTLTDGREISIQSANIRQVVQSGTTKILLINGQSYYETADPLDSVVARAKYDLLKVTSYRIQNAFNKDQIVAFGKAWIKSCSKTPVGSRAYLILNNGQEAFECAESYSSIDSLISKASAEGSGGSGATADNATIVGSGTPSSPVKVDTGALKIATKTDTRIVKDTALAQKEVVFAQYYANKTSLDSVKVGSGVFGTTNKMRGTKVNPTTVQVIEIDTTGFPPTSLTYGTVTYDFSVARLRNSSLYWHYDTKDSKWILDEGQRIAKSSFPSVSSASSLVRSITDATDSTFYITGKAGNTNAYFATIIRGNAATLPQYETVAGNRIDYSRAVVLDTIAGTSQKPVAYTSQGGVFRPSTGYYKATDFILNGIVDTAKLTLYATDLMVIDTIVNIKTTSVINSKYVQFKGNGRFKIDSTGSLTINSFFNDTKNKIFDYTDGVTNKASIILSASSIGFTRPEWFGAIVNDGLDDYAPMQKCLDVNVASVIQVNQLSRGIYDIWDGLTIYKKSGIQYVMVNVNVRGEGETFDNQWGTGIKSHCDTCYAIASQYNRNAVFENIEFSSSSLIFPTTVKQMIEWTDSDWNLSGVKRDNRYSPNAAIVIDPFNAATTLSNQYPTKTAFYTNTGAGGSSQVTIKGCKIRYFIVGVMVSPSNGTQNGDNIKAENCSFSNLKVAWATGQSQSRGNSIENCYFIGSIQYLCNTTDFGAGNGTAPNFINLNIAGGTKYLIKSGAEFGDINWTNCYGETVWAIGQHTGRTLNFNNCTIALLMKSGTTDPEAPLFLHSGGKVNFFGGSLVYFSNCTTKQIFNFNSTYVSFIGTSIQGGVVKNGSLSSNSYPVNFVDARHECFGSGATFSSALNAPSAIVNQIGRLMPGGSTIVDGSSSATFTSTDLPIQHISITATNLVVEYTSALSTTVFTTTKGVVKLGDNLVSNSSATTIYANQISQTGVIGYGYVTNIVTGGGVDTITTSNPSGGLSNSASVNLNIVHWNQFLPPMYGTLASGNDTIKNVSVNSAYGLTASMVGIRLNPINNWILAGSYILEVNNTSKWIRMSRTANFGNANTYIFGAGYSSRSFSKTLPTTGAFEPNAIVWNNGQTDSLVIGWRTGKGGVFSASIGFSPTFVPIYGEQKPTVTKTANYTASKSTDYTILANAVSGGFTITLDSVIWRVPITIKKTDASANVVYIIPPTSNIDGFSQIALRETGESITIESDGSVYRISSWYNSLLQKGFKYGTASDTSTYTFTKTIAIIDTTNNFTYSKRNSVFWNRNVQYYREISGGATTVDVSANAATGYTNLVASDLNTAPTDLKNITVVINGIEHRYKASQSADSGYTWSFSGTTISPFNGTGTVTINQILVQKNN